MRVLGTTPHSSVPPILTLALAAAAILGARPLAQSPEQRSSASVSPGGFDAAVPTTVKDNDISPPVPTSEDDAYTTPSNTLLVVPPSGVLENDDSNGGGQMIAAVVDNVTHGSLFLAHHGGITYMPTTGYAGPDSFTYRAFNGAGFGNIATVSLTVIAPTTIQPPTGLHASSIVGNLVTLRWSHAGAPGPLPSGHVLEGGLQPGEVLGSIATGSPYPIFTVTVPTGSFYLRMHATNGAERSGPSNEVRVFVNVPEPPSAPANVVGLANGSSLTLAWRNTFGGGPPTGLVLHVIGSYVGELPLVGVPENFTVGPVPPGTYTLQLRATNAAGISGFSNSVTLTFPSACSGPPLAPANFLAYRTDNTVHVIWNPPTTGPAPTSYAVNVTGAFTGSIPTTARSLSGVPSAGTYNLSVTATNPCGSATTPVQTIVIP